MPMTTSRRQRRPVPRAARTEPLAVDRAGRGGARRPAGVPVHRRQLAEHRAGRGRGRSVGHEDPGRRAAAAAAARSGRAGAGAAAGAGAESGRAAAEVEQPVAPKPPDIALEREKRKAEKRKLLEEQRQEEKKLEEEKLAQGIEGAEKSRAAGREEGAGTGRQEGRGSRQEAGREKEAAPRRSRPTSWPRPRPTAAEQQKLDKLRADEMRRITAGAGTSGEAPKSTAPRIDTGYLASITSKIKSTTSYPGSTDVPGNPKAVFKVEAVADRRDHLRQAGQEQRHCRVRRCSRERHYQSVTTAKEERWYRGAHT